MTDTVRNEGAEARLSQARKDSFLQQYLEARRYRLIRELRDDDGITFRKIASHVGLSHVEVQRRYKAQADQPPGPSPREIILQRAAGEITAEKMLETLMGLEYTSHLPAANDWDPTAAITSVRGTIHQIGKAFDDGLLTEAEHDAIVTNPDLKVHRTRDAAQ